MVLENQLNLAELIVSNLPSLITMRLWQWIRVPDPNLPIDPDAKFL